jgi:hypothetical protein
MIQFPSELQDFVNNEEWTFAKTIQKWPHEYIVRERVDEVFFVKLVEHIRSNGYQGYFYKKQITYYEEDGLVYWTMGAPISETIIVNKCIKENTYESRLANGTLPN